MMRRTVQIRVDREATVDVRLILGVHGSDRSEQSTSNLLRPGEVLEVECLTTFPKVETNDRIVGVRKCDGKATE